MILLDGWLRRRLSTRWDRLDVAGDQGELLSLVDALHDIPTVESVSLTRNAPHDWTATVDLYPFDWDVRGEVIAVVDDWARPRVRRIGIDAIVHGPDEECA